ncbi:hypothetical protein [Bacillus velezensis]|uniref:hypothetical protein n=1 Tax=Bacillus velezensis TaxID=492670 RepID=UPI000F8C33BE|nr:hypothetical protein [Bacillus velezensis]RUS07853.1 hypothetical protein EFW58_00601 [Bacillus velezensis]
MFLYYKDEKLGEIHDVSGEGMWMYGILSPYENIKVFRDLFNDLIDEDGDFDETKYDQEWLNDENWFVSDNGIKKGIIVPAVYPDGAINWRQR